MEFKYGDIISLKDGVMSQMSLDKETFFSYQTIKMLRLKLHHEGFMSVYKCRKKWKDVIK